MKKGSKNFNFWVPLEIQKGKDKTGKEIMKLGGIASTADEDSDEEVLEPSGFDVKPLLTKGTVNWHHQSKNDPSAIIGEPTKAQVTKKGLYIETELYSDSDMAKKVYDLAKTLEKNSSTRRLGFSIEGKALERDPMNPKRITKASITGVAVTHAPKNSQTLAQIIKGEVDSSELEFDVISEETVEGNNVKIIADITKADGTRVLVDSEGKITFSEIEKAKKSEKEEESEKALDTETTGKVLKKEHVDGDLKDQLSTKKELNKAEVIEIIKSDFSGINEKDTEKVYNIIKKVSENMEKKQITSEAIEKAYEVLGLTESISEATDIEKAKEYSFKEMKKGEKSYFKKMEKAKDGSEKEADDEMYKKVEKGEDCSYEKMSKAEKEELEEKKETKKEEAKEVEKASDSKKDEEKEEEASEKKDNKKEEAKEIKKAEDNNDIQKSIDNMLSKQTEMFGAMGTILKDFQAKNESFQKAIEERLEKIENEPVAGRKSLVKAEAIERFGKNEDNIEKAGGSKTYSASKEKGKVLNILESATFEKGFDDGFAKALTVFESSNFLPGDIVNRLKLEKGITITK